MKKIDRNSIDTLALYHAEMSKPYRKANDSGRVGKCAEVALKSYINPNSSITSKVTSQFKTYDLYFMGDNKKRVSLEIKTACGELAQTEDEDVSLTVNDIYPKASYILYCPEIAENIPMEDQFFVFERSAFIDMITSYNGKGSILRTKTATNGKTTLSLQSFYCSTRLKASKKIANHIWDCCYNQPTVKEWLA